MYKFIFLSKYYMWLKCFCRDRQKNNNIELIFQCRDFVKHLRTLEISNYIPLLHIHTQPDDP